MAKGVILKTNEGVKLMGGMQCSSGSWWNAETCYKYCNASNDNNLNELQVSKLKASSTSLNAEKNQDTKWYMAKSNFIDVEINYDVEQWYYSADESVE